MLIQQFAGYIFDFTVGLLDGYGKKNC